MTTMSARTSSVATDKPDELTWNPLRVFNFYRLTLSSLFLLAAATGFSEVFIGEEMPLLFRPTVVLYLIFALISLVAYYRRKPGFETQVYAQVLVDIIAITIIMHASGGVASGLGTLLVVAIAAGGILMAGRMANFFAAVATVAVLIEQFASLVFPHGPPPDFTKAGLLGATFFATAMLSLVLSSRIREGEKLAEEQSVDLANLAQLNEHIIQHMQSGVIAVDRDNGIRLTNSAAMRMLDWSKDDPPANLGTLSKELAEQLVDWRKLKVVEPRSIRTGAGEVIPRFNALGLRLTGAVLVFLDDASVLNDQAHQIRLASLGRLTGGIAHEIRNPLGAISHAAQLLDEAPDLTKQDRRLLEIIHNHSARVNEIIENILQLSRGSNTIPEPLELKPWLDEFIADFLFSSGMSPERLGLSLERDDMIVRFNPTQLNQIITNLCQNAIRHGTPEGEDPKFDVRAGFSERDNRPYLEICDYGKGIPDNEAQQVFDPFYSTHSQGTGLGLYIAREMCASNRARLDYRRGETVGSCFRITFAETNSATE
ncbi:MAG: PAS domain-containing protein [Chromatiales bacterium]|nr:PAS domain-containing protein [Gammaproteobacteria bacterium]MCP5351975.1 PAS domain-containing protein [Chromatiales bacterium]